MTQRRAQQALNTFGRIALAATLPAGVVLPAVAGALTAVAGRVDVLLSPGAQ